MPTTDLSVQLGPLRLRNPVIAASGTFGYGREFESFVSLAAFGAVAVKGLSLAPRAGNPVPRIVETRGGMLNAIGLQNVGVEAFERDKMPWLRDCGTTVIANFFGSTVEEYRACAARLSKIAGLAALEMNISCPNVKAGGIAFGTVPELCAEVVAAVRSVTHLPLIVKLSPNVTDIRPLAASAVAAGADMLSLINTLTGLAVDLERRRPALANVTGGLSGPAIKPVALRMVWEVLQVVDCPVIGLSGPAIKPVALRMVWEVLQVVDCPVIGLGGIWDATDALEFLCVGARAVQIGTVNFVNPTAAESIVAGIDRYLTERAIPALDGFIGTFRAGPA